MWTKCWQATGASWFLVVLQDLHQKKGSSPLICWGSVPNWHNRRTLCSCKFKLQRWTWLASFCLFLTTSRSQMSPSAAQTWPAAQPPGGGQYPPATVTTWGALTIALLRQQAPPLEGIHGLIGVKRQRAELKGEAGLAAGRGVIDSLSIIRLLLKNRYRQTRTSI